MDYPGLDGFLGTRASFMLDVVFLAMFLVLPLLAWSIGLARSGRFLAHKRMQVTLALVLLAAVVLFEVDMRWHGWTPRAEASPYYATGLVNTVLWIHLFFAVPTALIWIYVVVQALRKFPSPPQPGVHSAAHRFWGWLAAIEMACTAITGWIFYYLAFAAA